MPPQDHIAGKLVPEPESPVVRLAGQWLYDKT